MHPFVAVQESKDIPALPERHRLGRPRKAHRGPALAPRREDDRLLEWTERHGHLEHDPLLLELATRGQMRPGSVSQRLDHDLVFPSPRQAVEDTPGLHVREPGELAKDDHRGSIPALAARRAAGYASVIDSMV